MMWAVSVEYNASIELFVLSLFFSSKAAADLSKSGLVVLHAFWRSFKVHLWKLLKDITRKARLRDFKLCWRIWSYHIWSSLELYKCHTGFPFIFVGFNKSLQLFPFFLKRKRGASQDLCTVLYILLISYYYYCTLTPFILKENLK